MFLPKSMQVPKSQAHSRLLLPSTVRHFSGHAAPLPPGTKHVRKTPLPQPEIDSDNNFHGQNLSQIQLIALVV